MSIERQSRGVRARCDGCALTTPIMAAATSDAEVIVVLRTAGWTTLEVARIHGHTSYCPRCRRLPACRPQLRRASGA